MTKQQAIEHISRNKGKTFLIRPVTFHRFGIYQITEPNRAEIIIKDVTRAEANAILCAIEGRQSRCTTLSLRTATPQRGC